MPNSSKRPIFHCHCHASISPTALVDWDHISYKPRILHIIMAILPKATINDIVNEVVESKLLLNFWWRCQLKQAKILILAVRSCPFWKTWFLILLFGQFPSFTITATLYAAETSSFSSKLYVWPWTRCHLVEWHWCSGEVQCIEFLPRTSQNYPWRIQTRIVGYKLEGDVVLGTNVCKVMTGQYYDGIVDNARKTWCCRIFLLGV